MHIIIQFYLLIEMHNTYKSDFLVSETESQPFESLLRKYRAAMSTKRMGVLESARANALLQALNRYCCPDRPECAFDTIPPPLLLRQCISPAVRTEETVKATCRKCSRNGYITIQY